VTIISCIVQYVVYIVVVKEFQWGVVRNMQCYINILLCIAVVVAQMMGKAWLYLPFLQFNVG